MPAEARSQDPSVTESVHAGIGGQVRRFRLFVIEGPDRGASWLSSGDRCSIGTNQGNDLTLADASVSRFHCELVVAEDGVAVRDLGSKNGTMVDGVVVHHARLKSGSRLHLGRSVVQFEFASATSAQPLSERQSFGSLIGASAAMRATFGLLEQVSGSDSTVLLEGETGTGKEEAARAIHDHSGRKDGPFVIVDCGSIPPTLMESELFGHERGAFTGAADRHRGSFEDADHGTIFLDEIGELPLELQPKLLRALERRHIRRVGSTRYQPIDVRVIAATHRDLRVEVNSERFRSDLYYRLSVVRVPLPPLRERPEDIFPLVRHLLERMGADAAARAIFEDPAFIDSLRRGAWPGNVRELRNYVERCLVFHRPVPIGELLADDADGDVSVDPSLPYEEARRRAIEAFERAYVKGLLRRHQGRVAEAGRAAGTDRAYLWRLIKRHGIEVKK